MFQCKSIKIRWFFITATLIVFNLNALITPANPDPAISPTQVNTKDEKKLTENTSCIDQETNDLINRIMNGVALIEQACGDYCNAYGAMPLSLGNLFDGFLLLWPGNAIDGSPIQIISSPPDSSIPAQRGAIFYERINDYEACIHYSDVDRKNTTPGNIVWVTKKIEVLSNWAAYTKDPDNTDNWPGGKSLENKTSEERIKKAYRGITHTCFVALISDCYQRKGKLDESFIQSLENSDYYFIDNGRTHLIDLISKDEYAIDIKIIDGGEYVYYDTHATLVPPYCVHFDPSVKPSGKISLSYDCLENAKSIENYITTSDFKDMAVPENRIISKDNIF